MKKITFVLFLGLLSIFISSQAVLAQTNDVISPSEPENVIATAGDGQVTLRWDASADKDAISYKVYYGVQSVTVDGGQYQFPIETGNVLTYTVKNLKNGTTYYFAVTALDAAGNESENYSYEVSSTPKAGTTSADTVAPTVTSAIALTNTQVRVIFSESITLPLDKPEIAFSIEKSDTLEPLPVTKVEMDIEDIQGKTVLLTTSQQVAGASYTLTIGIAVEDTAGNPIESGESDTASFTGVSSTTPQPNQVVSNATDTTAPEIMSADATSTTQAQITFSEPVVVSGSDNFQIAEVSDSTLSLSVYSASLSDDKKTVTLTTEEQVANTEYEVKVQNVSDLAGNLIADNYTSRARFVNEQAVVSGSDTTPPEEVTNVVTAVQNNVAKLDWTASVNSVGDLKNYVVYVSTDVGKTYDQGTILAPDSTSYELTTDPALSYTFKISTRDTSGNESLGVTTSSCLQCPAELPKAGPGGLLALSLLSGVIGFAIVRRKFALKA